MDNLLASSQPSSFAVWAFGCLLLWYIATSLLAWHRLRHIPGPFLARFSYFWTFRTTRSGKQYEMYRDINDKYGSSLVRIGPSDLVTNDPEVIRMMSSAKGVYRRGDANSGNRFNPHHLTLLNMLEPKRHDQFKTKVAPAYSGRDTPGLESNVDEQLKSLISLIRRKHIAASGPCEKLPLGRAAGLFALDVISKVSLGKEFGCLREDSDVHEFYSTLRKHVPFMSMTIDVPWLRKIFYSDLYLTWMGPQETDSIGIGKLMGMTNDVVRKRFAPGAEPKKDMLGSFIHYGLTQRECEGESLFMFIAGSDTIAVVIRHTMLHILSSPRVYQKLKDEIRSAIREGKVGDDIIKNAESKNMPYLQAVISEGLRIRPVVPGLLFKEVPAGGDTINGQYIPGGTSIGIALASILRSKKVFGEDVEVFRPERFLEATPEQLAEMQRSTELQFGAGRWMCAGKPLAKMELNKVFFELFRHFDFQLVNPQHPMQSTSYLLWVDLGLEVRVTESDIMQETSQ
ncbi:Pisatin demethylase 7 [Colletotrichum chlorophyti]|uniref:Pisatin demethylase 7 n=1 Tax=Colletotrichum chlorophyti TaxID=708187 RepID=A0A1Q8S5T6_9PEZI|nr:Pisatin demethylase 7 [Colletotrichum chlorophyti]